MTREAVKVDARAESRDPFEFLLNVTRRFGDAVRYTGPSGESYLFNHPDYAREILQDPRFERTTMVKIVVGDGLVASDGEYWRAQRRSFSPFFVQDAARQCSPLILGHTNEFLERWETIADRGGSVDVSSEMTMLTLSIIVEILFGIRLGTNDMNSLCSGLNVLLDDIGAMGCSQLNRPLTFSASSKARFERGMESLERGVAVIIEEGRRRPRDPENFLSHLLAAKDGTTGRKLTEVQIRDEVVTMLIAGHETTALILSWALTLLAEEPSVEQRLHDEVDNVLGRSPPSVEDLSDLPYTLMVLRESMRLYPPIWFIARKSMEAGLIGDVQVPKDVLVITSPYALHRNPEIWPDPERFDPLRFSPEKRPPKFAYIPFGGGRHLCIGMNLALIEGHMILANITQRFRVIPVAGQTIEPMPAITLRMRHGLMATLERRFPRGTGV